MSEFNKILNQKAVALSYDEDKDRAPVIVASGRGRMAERMVELACENDVPVYEDHSLTNVLSQMELGSEIPEELYQMVVDIYVYFLKMVPTAAGKGGGDGKSRLEGKGGGSGQNREDGMRGGTGGRPEAGRGAGAGKSTETGTGAGSRKSVEAGAGMESVISGKIRRGMDAGEGRMPE